MEENKKNILLYLCFILSFLTFAYNLYLVDVPTLSHDEIFFAHKSLNFPDGKWIYPIPSFLTNFLNYPYAGLFKAYIYIPIYKIFGFSSQSTRYPIFLIQFITASFCLYFFKKIKLKILAFFMFFFFLSNPEINFLTKLDMQFISYQNLTEIILFYFFFKKILKIKINNYELIFYFIITILSLWSHLRFFFILSSFIYSYLIIELFFNKYRSSFFERIKLIIFKNKYLLILYFVSSLIFVTQIIYFQNNPSFIAATQLTYSLLFFIKRILTLFTGGLAVSNFGFTNIFILKILFLFLYIFIVIFLVKFKKRIKFNNANIFRLVYFSIIFLFFLSFFNYRFLSPYQNWNILILLPFIIIISLILNYMYIYKKIFKENLIFVIMFLFTLLWSLEFFYQQNKVLNYQSRKAESWLFYFNIDGFEKLQNLIENSSDNFLITSWGVQPQLQFLSKNKEKIRSSYQIITDKNAQSIIGEQNINTSERYIKYIRPVGRAILPIHQDYFDENLKKYCLIFKIENVVYDHFKNPVFEIGKLIKNKNVCP
jgi:hypothetical protein